MSKRIPALDLMFLLSETADCPTHVGALTIFELPARARPDTVRRIVAGYQAATPLPPFNCIADFSVGSLPRWKTAGTLDMGYHVQHLALPAGATDGDLLALVADLHESVLDRNRPGFRVFAIEGLPGGRFALYHKIHHALVDGVSGVGRILASMNASAGAKRIEPFYAVRVAPPPGRPWPAAALTQRLRAWSQAAVRQSGALTGVYAGAVQKVLTRMVAAKRPPNALFAAPASPLNGTVRSGRSFATLSLPLAQMRAVGQAHGATLNDVAVAIVDAGVQRYLARHRQRTREPLVAMCPVSLRAPGDREAATKASAMFVALGQPGSPPAARLREVAAALTEAKADIRAMSNDAAMLHGISALALIRVAEATGSGLNAKSPMANFVLSNVPGTQDVLFLNGARMLGLYPVSALGAGIGLNATLTSYGGNMDFGFIGDRALLPDIAVVAREVGTVFAALTATLPSPDVVAVPTKRARPRMRRAAAAA